MQIGSALLKSSHFLSWARGASALQTSHTDVDLRFAAASFARWLEHQEPLAIGTHRKWETLPGRPFVLESTRGLPAVKARLRGRYQPPSSVAAAVKKLPPLWFQFVPCHLPSKIFATAAGARIGRT